MTIDAFAGNNKYPAKPEEIAEQKGAPATILWLWAAIPESRFGIKNLRSLDSAVLLFRRHALWRTLRRLLVPASRSQRLRCRRGRSTRSTVPRQKPPPAKPSTTNQSRAKLYSSNCWTSWCEYCHQEEALVEEINKEFAGKGLVVLAIDVAESKKTVKKYLGQHPRSCRIVLTSEIRIWRPCIRPMFTRSMW